MKKLIPEKTVLISRKFKSDLGFYLLWILICAGFIPIVQAGETQQSEVKIGLALGGGGANGLAHIAILEVFDELEITPHRIAGSSIGAIMGALYCSGHSAEDIKQLSKKIIGQQTDVNDNATFNLDNTPLSWIDMIDMELGDGGLLNTSGVIEYLRENVKTEKFSELEIPLYVVACDLWTSEQVVFKEGEIYPALKATIAVPGLFAPVRNEDRFLVDGALINPVPYDLLFEECDIVIAVNVLGNSEPLPDPSFFETLFTSTQIMQTSIIREKIKYRQPHIFIDTQHKRVKMVAFHKLDEIYEQSLPAKKALKTSLQELLERTNTEEPEE